MASLSTLKYPNKSHRKKVTLPKYSAALAEFFGIMMGDGGIGNPWQATITLNSIADASYAEYVITLCKELFGISPTVRKRKTKNALVICLTSTTIVDFLIDNGLIRGNKLKQGLTIPKWILKEKRYKLACIRGLSDTDGGLYIHKHIVLGKQYKNIGFCFTSYSRDLIYQVSGIFEEFGIIPHISTREQNIYLYRADSVTKYLCVFGTSNERLRVVYKDWKHGGVG